jgi:phage minor structural protein
MYQVSIFNNGVETIVHYPTADIDAPHVLSLPFKESLSSADQLSFSIPVMNPGYSLIQGLKTKVKVYDTRDNSVIFSGRVIPTKDGISNDGKITKEVTCEGALAYLNDTNTRRWNFSNKMPSYILQYLLNEHNSKVNVDRRIQLGNIELTQSLTIDTNYETTLNAIITKLHNILGGDIRVQERNSILYLDYLLDQGVNNGVEIRLGYNLKQMMREYDPINIITRLVPLGYGEGINQLDISEVNSGVDYLEDAGAKATYGVIEGVVTNKDIQNGSTLKLYGQTVLNEKKQPRLTYQQTALDLSVLTGHEDEKYSLGDTLHTICEVLNIDVYSRVIERERDLINEPWNPTLTISTRPITLTNEIVDLKQRNLTLENAPQGSTYIDTFGYAENIDGGHPFQLPIWISPDILNVNRVRLHIDGQQYRAYERGMAAGGGITATSSSSAAFTVTSTSGGGVTTSSSSGGGESTTSSSSSDSTTSFSTPGDLLTGAGMSEDPSDPMAHFHAINGSDVSHSHNMSHYHWFSVSDHSHTVSIPDHAHSVTIDSHAHTVSIPNHSHELDYGILEDSYPDNVYVILNEQTIAGPFGNGNSFSEDLDLTPYIGMPGATYNLEITSGCNGRVNVWVSVQAFIQAK